MTKGLYLSIVASFLFALLWFPARHEATDFERIVIREAAAIEEGRYLPSKRLTADGVRCLLAGYDLLSGVVPDFEVRPQGAPDDGGTWSAMEGAARRTLATPYFRSLRSWSMMVLQRYALIGAAWVTLLPFWLAMLVDGLVERRIRAAELRAPRPSLWRASVSAGMVFAGLALVLPLCPGMSPEGPLIMPLLGALSLRTALAYWHRFL